MARPGPAAVHIVTGGGFPVIPLAILLPASSFHLIDSIGKKANVVETIAKDLGLLNVTVEQVRAEELTGAYDFAVARAVTKTKDLVQWADPIMKQRSINDLPNGLLLLKGGDLKNELQHIDRIHYSFSVEEFFSEPFFAFKQVIYIAL
jgi:16S rRNA (guanine527-N7)-methyltransferase